MRPRQKKRSVIILKADFEKAYDSVRWSFLYDMMKWMGFPMKWIRWIQQCFETATVSVLVNGSPTEEFRMQRGLRQGDPLAPFLFLIVAEGLSALMRRAVSEGLFKGVEVGNNGERVACLQYADDTLFMGEASLQNVTIKSVLRCFELATGLKVNFFKSSLGGVMVENREM